MSMLRKSDQKDQVAGLGARSINNFRMTSMVATDQPSEAVFHLHQLLAAALETADNLRLDMVGIHINSVLLSINDLLEPDDGAPD